VGNGRFFLRWEVGWGRADGGWVRGQVGEKNKVYSAANAVSYDVGWKMA
jgi:hypothetical protein